MFCCGPRFPARRSYWNVRQPIGKPRSGMSKKKENGNELLWTKSGGIIKQSKRRGRHRRAGAHFVCRHTHHGGPRREERASLSLRAWRVRMGLWRRCTVHEGHSRLEAGPLACQPCNIHHGNVVVATPVQWATPEIQPAEDTCNDPGPDRKSTRLN